MMSYFMLLELSGPMLLVLADSMLLVLADSMPLVLPDYMAVPRVSLGMPAVLGSCILASMDKIRSYLTSFNRHSATDCKSLSYRS